MQISIRALAALVLAVLALAGQAHAQSGFDRRGGDYLRFEIRNGDPAVCATRCERDARCHAWSFSYPRTENAVAVCWLKNKVPPRVEDKCCVSGVRGAGVIEPRKGPIEYSIDRLGGDYRNLEVATDPRRAMQGSVRGGEQMPRLDLCAARLHWAGGALLSQGQDYASAPQAVLYFGGGAIGLSAPR